MSLRRIFDDYAYGDGPRNGCWWDETCSLPRFPRLEEEITADVAVIGGGFTGVSAALRLAEKGVDAVLLEAHEVGWGASGRNGGFCCLGGGKISDKALDLRFGREERLAYRSAEKAAVAGVAEFISANGLDVDQHSRGETALAHRPKDMEQLRRDAEAVSENYGVDPRLIERGDLERHGMQGGPFFGAMTIPIGFGLNPRKYLAGLVAAAEQGRARFFAFSPVHAISRRSGKHRLSTPVGKVMADHVIVATNGYSSENLPPWVAGRYMPSQSTVHVTRPLTRNELISQGWTTRQMSYDTRHLLHYFRLMPDNRFLFGMRGGLRTGVRPEAAARAKTRADFERMFPAWSKVETTHCWSGLVSLARNRLPFVGQVPENPGLWAAMCYHGNGVAMASYAGRMVAERVMGRPASEYPLPLQAPMKRFPLGKARRLLMGPLYAGLALQDRV
ncbi:MAG: FAD-binding oxidoreductase [Pseudomonadota bacterium]